MTDLSNSATRYEKMAVKICDDMQTCSDIIADEVIATIKKSSACKKCVLCLDACSEAIQIYQHLTDAYKRGEITFENVIIYSKDDYYPLSKSEIQSHYRFLKEYLFDATDIPADNIRCIDSEVTEDVRQYCEKYEKMIEADGGFDILISSLGGFNQPGSSDSSVTRLVTLNHNTRVGAAGDFFGVEYVPKQAITIGISLMLSARKVFLISVGESAASGVKTVVEGDVTKNVPMSYFQRHQDCTLYIDNPASALLVRIDTPWLVGSCEWTDFLTRKAVFWLCSKLGKPILKLTERDYNDNQLGDLVATIGNANKLNIKVFNDLQHTITGWPGGKPNADDSTRPERALPYPKRVIVFSPHPDDDVISMGGTVARLSEHGHEVHLAYETSGNIAVFDHEVIKYLDTFAETCLIYPKLNDVHPVMKDIYNEALEFLSKKRPGEPDSACVREIKGAIRRGEASQACKYLGIPKERVHFLNLPFYETGGVKKNPLSDVDVKIVKDLIQQVKPHQIYAAGDLSDPHGTHRVCTTAVIKALEELSDEPWMADCRVWLYRGAWQEWDVAQQEMAVPLSPEEVQIKREAIFRHQSQKDRPLFPGTDNREFWMRAEERNHNTAVIFDKLGMAEYQAIELFVKYKFDGKL